MREHIHCVARWIPEGVCHRALKAEVEVVDGKLNELLWDLALYRHAMQRTVDALWDLDKVPKKSRAHQMFYNILRSHGFRAHVARNIYSHALTLVESTRKNKGSKPVIKKLSARLDYQDARVELGKGVVRVIIRDKWYTLKLKHGGDYIWRFKELRWKEVHVKYENRKLYVSVVFESDYKPYIPRGIIALDVNLRAITTYNGSEVRRFKTRFADALTKRKRAEELQGKYPKRWRRNEKILNRIRSLHGRARNIAADYCWKIAKLVVLDARRKQHTIAVEDLEGLRESFNNKSDRVTWKLTMFAYRRLQHSIISKALECGVPVIVVDPRDTSRTCPRCGFARDRDSIGAVNIWLRALYAYVGVPESLPRAPAVKDEARQSGGTNNEGMKKAITAIHR